MSTQSADETKAKPSLAEQILVLHMNGWFPAFAVSFVLIASLVFSEGARVVLLGGTLALITASLFSLAVGPLLCRWRASMTGKHFFAASALLCLGLLVWTVLNLSLCLLLATYLLAGWTTSPDQELLQAFDSILDTLGYGPLAVAWLCGMATCVWGRGKLSKHQGWSYAGAVLWRRILALILLIPYALLVLKAGSMVWLGGRLDDGLWQAYSEQISTAIKQKGLTLEEKLESELPSAFRDNPVVAAWLRGEASTTAAQNTVLRLWCKEAARLWTEKDLTSNPELVALARLAHQRGIVERSDLSAAERTEVAVRSEVVLLERGGVSSIQSQRLYDTVLPAETWQRLLEVSLSRDDLLRGATLTDEDVGDQFVQAGVRVVDKSDYDMDGNLQRRFFVRCGERAQLNRLWRAYEAGKPYPEAATPPNFEQFRKRYASSLAFDLRAVDEDVLQATFKEDLNRQNLAYNIVLMELKRLVAKKAPLPKSWSEFRPEVAAVGQAYSDWIVLTPTGQGVALRRTDPRQGMSLSHTFNRG